MFEARNVTLYRRSSVSVALGVCVVCVWLKLLFVLCCVGHCLTVPGVAIPAVPAVHLVILAPQVVPRVSHLQEDPEGDIS